MIVQISKIHSLHQRIMKIPYQDNFGCCIPHLQLILQYKLHQSFLRFFLTGCWFAFLLHKFWYTLHIANLSIRNQLQFYDQQKIILVECFVGQFILINASSTNCSIIQILPGHICMLHSSSVSESPSHSPPYISDTSFSRKLIW